MSYGRNVIYLYDGSFDGFLTTVFECFSIRKFPSSIENTLNGQQSLDAEYLHINTDTSKAERVLTKVFADSGKQSAIDLYRAFLSNLPEKEMTLFNYIRACMKFKRTVNGHLTVKCIADTVSASQSAASEAHLYTGFVRFAELKNGVYYGKIEPKNNILPLVAPHFVNRYSNMPFIIHDTVRKQCLVYDTKNCNIYTDTALSVLQFSDTESEYRKMWKNFYDTVEIKERHNDQCRMTHMPKRYWKFMTEFL